MLVVVFPRRPFGLHSWQTLYRLSRRLYRVWCWFPGRGWCRMGGRLFAVTPNVSSSAKSSKNDLRFGQLLLAKSKFESFAKTYALWTLTATKYMKTRRHHFRLLCKNKKKYRQMIKKPVTRHDFSKLRQGEALRGPPIIRVDIVF